MGKEAGTAHPVKLPSTVVGRQPNTTLALGIQPHVLSVCQARLEAEPANPKGEFTPTATNGGGRGGEARVWFQG